MQDFASYVVCAVGSLHPAPFVHFLSPNDAAGYARVRANSPGFERAYVFGVATAETGAAYNAILSGEAEMVDSVVHGTLDVQIVADHKRAWEQAREADSDAIRKFLGR